MNFFKALRRRKIDTRLKSVGFASYGMEHLRILSWDPHSKAVVTVGSYTSISAQVTLFLGGNHNSQWTSTYPFGHLKGIPPFTSPVQGHPQSERSIHIGNDVWIGRNVTIMSGLTIGDGAIIAANSHVIKSVPPYAIVGGNPATLIRFRFDNRIIEELLELRWWEFSPDKINSILPLLTCPPTKETIEEMKTCLGI